MADTESSPATAGEESNSNPSLPENPPQESNQPDPSPTPSSSAPSTSVAINPNPVLPPPPILAPPQPPPIQPYGVPPVPAVLPGAPSFRPATPPLPVPSAPQFSPLPVPNLQNHNYPTSGVQNLSVPPPGVPGNSGSMVPMMQQQPQYAPPGQHLNQAYRPYMTMPNGYPAMQMPQGALPPPGLPRYPYAPMVRPAFPQRPPGPVGVIPQLMRAPIPGIRGPIIPPIIRPVSVPSVTPAEKPETTVYVGKMSSTVDNDFMLSLLQLCGPIKSWKRPQDPAHGTLKSFGFCEFESAEGVLRALRLLNKLNLDGQELVINVNQATREYLERYVQKKSETIKKSKENGSEGSDKAEENTANADSELPKLDTEDSKKDESDSGTEKNDAASFGIVTDEDKEADQDALEKLTDMLEERLRNNPLPPPPPPPPRTPADGFANSNSEHPARSRDGEPDVDIMKHDGSEEKNEDEITSDNKPTNEHDRPDTSSPDRTARHDRRGRGDRDPKRERERELERYEREREQERARRERERDYKVKDDERRYKARVKEWESREKEKEYLRKQENQKEKDRISKRKREVLEQEHEDDDGDSRRRKHRNSGSDEKRRRLREKEEDLEDKLREEEEVAEAKRKAEEENRLKKEREKDAPETLPDNINDKTVLPHETDVEIKVKVEETSDGDFEHRNHIGEEMLQNGNGDDIKTEQVAASDTLQHKKLGFGLVGSGKRTAVPSVFSEDEDENAQKEKKMRPLVPIDYSTEEVQAVQSTVSTPPSSNLAAATEFAKRISSGTPKEDRPDVEKERSRRSHDRYNQRDRDRNDDDSNRTRDSSRRASERDRDRDRDREHGMDKVKTPENRKLMDAKQLIDMIPKTKEELFSYEINWTVYDKNDLHDRLRPWISKKITEFLGEEETTLVDYIVSSMREHVKASEMLDRLQSILDDESEMFVLKMWRMLIFEIKKIETGLSLRSKS